MKTTPSRTRRLSRLLPDDLHSVRVDLYPAHTPHRAALVVHEEVDRLTGEVLWTFGVSTYDRMALDAVAAVFGVELQIKVSDLPTYDGSED